MAVSSIILSKTFDNGMICASEQSVIVVDSIYEEVRQEFIRLRPIFFPRRKAKSRRDSPKRWSYQPRISSGNR
ncbi:MAG UNVERIFIED_CONTAM: hypothetical protein LVR29_23065 [Microcystis novacekii LVE1205-3]